MKHWAYSCSREHCPSSFSLPDYFACFCSYLLCLPIAGKLLSCTVVCTFCLQTLQHKKYQNVFGLGDCAGECASMFVSQQPELASKLLLVGKCSAPRSDRANQCHCAVHS
jgi:hypothetical protein